MHGQVKMGIEMNGPDELLAEVARAVARQRGYADFFDWPEKRQKELGLLEVFAEAFRSGGGIISAEHLTEPGLDPPDGEALSQAGVRIGIELVELVDQGLIERQKRDPHRTQWRDWTGKELRETLSALVGRKDSTRQATSLLHNLSEYWTVIHTDEPALTPGSVARHVAGFRVGPCRLVTRCFLLMSYSPAIKGYPLVEIPVRRTFWGHLRLWIRRLSAPFRHHSLRRAASNESYDA